MKNNKGFTLIELLAVVVLMLAISVMAISSISAAIERSKEKENNIKKEVIEGIARLYYEEHKNGLNKDLDTEEVCIDINDLPLSEEEKKDANGEFFSGKIKISNNGKNFDYVDSCP